MSGRRTVAQDPRPGSDVIAASPPRLRTIERTASMPTPRPDTSVATAVVEKPGWKSSSMASLTPSPAAACSAISPRRIRN